MGLQKQYLKYGQTARDKIFGLPPDTRRNGPTPLSMLISHGAKFNNNSVAVIILGIITLIVGVLLSSIPWIDYFILKNLRLWNNTLSFHYWQRPGVIRLTKVYIFNVTNPDGFLNGEKPKLVEVGPFVYRDIFTALLDGRVCTAMRDLLISRVNKSNVKIDAIVGLDARGFLFGFAIAAELGIPFVPIRKKGKLPGKCRSFEYTLEYGSGIYEIQENSVKPGQNVVIVDDLLATGGTLNAAYQLVTACGANVAEIIVIIELKSLKGRSNIPTNNIYTFITYD